MNSFSIIVYQIYHQDSSLNVRYIGSTKQKLSARWYKHKDDYKRWKQGNTQYNCAIVDCFEKYGYEKFKCSELGTYEVNNRQQQFQHEQEWIEKLECVNKIKSFNVNKLHKSNFCDLCEYKFNYPYELRNHLNGEDHWKTLFPCWNLDYNFQRRKMTWEIEIEKEERKEIKKQKDREYSKKPEVKERLRKNHRKHEQTEKGKATIQRYRQSDKWKQTNEANKKRIIEEKQYYCSICDWAFTSKQILTKHNQRKH